MSDRPILYSFRRCPYAMRARLAIWSSGLAVELREIVLRDKAPEFLAASPSATVPCLVVGDGTVIDESLDIMLWALGQQDPEGWLSPETGSLDDILRLIEENDGLFKRHLDRYKYDTRHPDADREGERAAGADFLMKLEQRLASGNWFFGSHCGLADYAILPFVRQFANVDRDWFDTQPWPLLLQGLRNFEAGPLFAAIMPKVPRWENGQEPLLFGGSK